MPESFFIYFVTPAMILVYILVVDEIYGGHIYKRLSRNAILKFLLNSVVFGGFLGISFWALSDKCHDIGNPALRVKSVTT